MEPRPWMTKRTRPSSGARVLASALALTLVEACSDGLMLPGPPGAGGGGGSGGAAVCSPGETRACYPGPPGTQGVGICTAGVETCLPDGSAFTPCEGAVLPEPQESCGTETDDDCDGTADDPDASCVCKPGLLEACYNGPASTAGLGLCTAGLRTCDASGTTWRPCEGEVTPQQETCDDDTDEDCDGIVCSALRWGKLFGDANVQSVTSAGTDALGNVYLAGTFAGSIAFGEDVLVSAGTADVFIASLDGSGNYRWSMHFGGAGAETLAGVAVTPTGEVVLTGTFYGSMAFGSMTLTSANSLDSFVARLDASGVPAWAVRLGETSDQTVRGVALDDEENVLIAGDFTGVLLCTSPPIPVCVTTAGGSDVFVRKYDRAGAVVWTQRLGDSQDQFTRGIAVDRDRNVLVTGRYSGTLALGSQQVVNSGLGANLFVMKLDRAGNAVWMRDYGDTKLQEGNAIATDAANRVLVTGSYTGSIDFGPAGVLTGSETKTAFAASLSAGGTPRWARSFGVDGNHTGLAIAADAEDRAVLTGSAQGTIDLGGGPLSSAGGLDAFVVKLDGSGRYVWGKLLGSAGDQKGNAVALSPRDGAVVIAGSAGGPIDFGFGELGANGTDAFAAVFSP